MTGALLLRVVAVVAQLCDERRQRSGPGGGAPFCHRGPARPRPRSAGRSGRGVQRQGHLRVDGRERRTGRLLLGVCGRRSPRVGEAEAGVAGRPATQGVREDGDVDVVVVVHPGSLLAGVRPHDASDVLDEAALEGDRRHEEQRVEGRAVEALTKVGAGRDREQRRSPSAGARRARAAARALTPSPPRSTTGSCPGLEAPRPAVRREPSTG